MCFPVDISWQVCMRRSYRAWMSQYSVMLNGSCFSFLARQTWDIVKVVGLLGRDFISVFFKRGAKFWPTFRGGAKYEKNKILCAKTQKSLFFKIRGGGQMPAALPPKWRPCYKAILGVNRLFNKRISQLTLFICHGMSNKDMTYFTCRFLHVMKNFQERKTLLSQSHNYFPAIRSN